MWMFLYSLGIGIFIGLVVIIVVQLVMVAVRTLKEGVRLWKFERETRIAHLAEADAAKGGVLADADSAPPARECITDPLYSGCSCTRCYRLRRGIGV